MAENKQIHISVRNKIAELVDKEQYLVCGNNDYEVVFDFDGDWDGINAKTAVFVYGNTPVHQPFVGNVCEGVEIRNATLCAIGVFAGDIKTTTGATICCRQSIRDIGGVPQPPKKEVYDEIMALLDKAIEAHTELPIGGKTGQVLKKSSDKDYDTYWADDEMRDLSNYQTKTDESLETESKKVVGAINELNKGKLSEEQADVRYVPIVKEEQSAHRVYITQKNGSGVGLITVRPRPYAYEVVQRSLNGNILLPNIESPDDPTTATDELDIAISKREVYNLILGIEEELIAINEGGIE